MILAHAVPPFATRGLSGCTGEEDGLVAKVGTSEKGSTISLLTAVHLECMLQAQLKRRRTNVCIDWLVQLKGVLLGVGTPDHNPQLSALT
jgi:hypothetical protein